jgi:ATP-dependent RNA helicase HelY
VLEDGDLTPGDFVRWTRQVVDLLGQLGQAAHGGHGTPADAAVAAVARDAIAVIDRGVVATAGVDR